MAAILNGGRGCPKIIVKGDQTRTILANFSLIWLSGFRGEVLDPQHMPIEGKSSNGLWPGELKCHHCQYDIYHTTY